VIFWLNYIRYVDITTSIMAETTIPTEFMNASSSDSENTLSSVQDPSQQTILHLAGSVESQFLFDLSLMYCKTSWETLTKVWTNSWLAVVTPDKTWYIVQKFDNAVSTEPYTQEQALKKLKSLDINAVVPHMFCNEGMTTYRALMEEQGYKLMGNNSKVCAIASHKERTKEVLRKSNVRVPDGVHLTKRSDAPQTFRFPCIVKPCDLDNSVGVSYCETQEEYEAALDHVFTLTSQVLIEEYIAGDEVRCGIVETKDNGLRALPMIKYLLTTKIRGAAQKLITTEDKKIQGFATKASQTELPAKLSETTKQRIEQAAKDAHAALGCELYSLFDFRVNEKEVVLLEACLFCSFSPKSVLPTLARAENTNAVEFFQNMLEVRLSK